MKAKDNKPAFGVLLVNLGTPTEPTPRAVRAYLKEFLSDRRVIKFPRVLWYFLLRGVILPLRSPRVAKNYQKIWTGEGSPLRVISQRQRTALEKALKISLNEDIPVEIGMCYGTPSLQDAWIKLRDAQVSRLLVLPLYPQYSSTTTAAVFDKITQIFARDSCIPECRFVNDYHAHEGYIKALATHVRSHWQSRGRAKQLLLSFHSIPKSYYEQGDMYPEYCHRTGLLLAKELGLSENEWQVTFQSRFGKTEWIQPYTLDTLKRLGQQKLESIDVISPGFSADCLETLEELDILNRGLFQKEGGGEFRYIPALNDSAEHIDFLSRLVLEHAHSWWNNAK